MGDSGLWSSVAGSQFTSSSASSVSHHSNESYAGSSTLSSRTYESSGGSSVASSLSSRDSGLGRSSMRPSALVRYVWLLSCDFCRVAVVVWL